MFEIDLKTLQCCSSSYSLSDWLDSLLFISMEAGSGKGTYVGIKSLIWVREVAERIELSVCYLFRGLGNSKFSMKMFEP